MTSDQTSRSVGGAGGALDVAGATDRGTVRPDNQDMWDAMQRPDGSFALVLADGMGGHAGGAEAAGAAVDAAVAVLAGPGGDRTPEAVIEAAVADATSAVGLVRQRLGGSPGTTLVLALVQPQGATVVGNVGDSRAYLLHAGTARQITTDHSWVAEQVAQGRMSPDEARHHPQRNMITRAVMGDAEKADLFSVELAAGDTLFLCSDGIWEPLDDASIAELLTDSGTLQRALEGLCDAALTAGSRDNVTVVAARRAVEPGGAR